MAQLASIASLVGTGLGVYGQVRTAQQQRASSRVQEENLRQQQAAQQAQADAQSAARARERQQGLARTIAAARARLGAGGVAPDEGSAAALAAGLTRDAAQDAAEEAAVTSARLAAGRRSLLTPDGSLNSFLRAGQSLGGVVRNLLD
ncbi:hypothetical protein [Roseomonas sp. HF4]|uniref:hypothetical protein n=1 Tax=Roseomonas sp. HF4 TaxID=2562313 RepID=UPI0010C060AC|nr:hypothetical protein [Roseomonas sp. HF4]